MLIEITTIEIGNDGEILNGNNNCSRIREQDGPVAKLAETQQT